MPLVNVVFQVERHDLDHHPQLAQSIAAGVNAYVGQKVAVSIFNQDGSAYTHPEFDPKWTPHGTT